VQSDPAVVVRRKQQLGVVRGAEACMDVEKTSRACTEKHAPVTGSQPFCALNATAVSLQTKPTFLPIVTSLNTPAGPANWYRNAESALVSCCAAWRCETYG
jgi:hypothetical protein